MQRMLLPAAQFAATVIASRGAMQVFMRSTMRATSATSALALARRQCS
jgi:hypothetical protein